MDSLVTLKEHDSKNVVDVYIDVLCWESVNLLINQSNIKIGNIYYSQKVNYFSKRMKKRLETKMGAKVLQIQNYNVSELFVNNISAYEEIQGKVKDILDKAADRWMELSVIKEYLMLHGFNNRKLKNYLQKKAYSYIFRAIEIIVVSEILSPKNKMFVFFDTPLREYVLEENKSCIFYRVKLSKHCNIHNREDFFYDDYLISAFKNISGSYRWFVTKQYVLYFFRYLLNVVSKKSNNEFFSKDTNIGIDQVTPYVREFEYHDQFWLKSNHVNPKNVINIETVNQDRESSENLKKYGVSRVKVNPSIKELMCLLLSPKNHKEKPIYIVPQFKFFVKNFSLLSHKKNKHKVTLEEFWLVDQIYLFLWRESYWKSLYKKINIRVLWSMSDDIGGENMCKAQAIESLGGYYVGSHWSLYPVYTILTRKTYDIFLTWGKYFSNDFFGEDKGFKLDVGYPADFCFLEHVDSRKELDSDKYTITYFDNNTGHEFQLSQKMNIDMMKLLVNIVKNYDNVFLLYKPKRAYEFEILKNKVPDFISLIKQKKIQVFVSQQRGRRLSPVSLGMRSNIVVGLGINTAVAECYFAGVETIHANLAKFNSFSFSQSGKGAFIFDDLGEVENKLKNKIEQRVSDESDKAQEKETYSMLDSYMDGKAYDRVALAIKKAHKASIEGRSLKDVFL